MGDGHPLPAVTIGFIAKEKFHFAAPALDALINGTRAARAAIPFELLIVDGGSPPRYRAELEAVLARAPDVDHRFLVRPGFLQPNQARNVVAREARHPYLAFVENDSFVAPGWLEGLLDACLSHPGGCAAFPEMFDGWPEDGKPHVDATLAHIRTVDVDGRPLIQFVRDEAIFQRFWRPRRQMVDVSECHVFVLSKRAYDAIGGFDEQISTREHCDLSLSLRAANIPLVLDGNVRVAFFAAPPVYPDELPFYRFVWDLRAARRTLAHLQTKWDVVNLPGSIGFVFSQAFRTDPGVWRAYNGLRRRVPAFARLLEDGPLASAALAAMSSHGRREA